MKRKPAPPSALSNITYFILSEIIEIWLIKKMENDEYRKRTWKGLEAKKKIGIKIKIIIKEHRNRNKKIGIETDENSNRNRRKWK